MEQSIWIVLSDNDWLFGYLMNVPGVHTAGRSCVMAYKSQNSWEGFPLSWKWVLGENPLDLLEMSHLHYMFGKKHEWDGIDYVGKTCVDMKCKKELGVAECYAGDLIAELGTSTPELAWLLDTCTHPTQGISPFSATQSLRPCIPFQCYPGVVEKKSAL